MSDRINIICETHGTTLERIRKLKHCMGNDLKALIDISKYLHFEQHQNLTDIGDLLFRHRSTIKHYLEFDSNRKEIQNKSLPPASGGLHSH